MKAFDDFQFDANICRVEIVELAQLLASKDELEEATDVLPFFRQHRHIAAFLGYCYLGPATCDRIAFEYDLFGDFRCDLVVGDSLRSVFLLIEFEDAKKNSVFQSAPRAKSKWARRFEQGYSQLIDWRFRLNDERQTLEFQSRFGTADAKFQSMLVIGRRLHMSSHEASRFQWRRERVVVDSQHIRCVTYDDLLDDVTSQFHTFATLAEQFPQTS